MHSSFSKKNPTLTFEVIGTKLEAYVDFGKDFNPETFAFMLVGLQEGEYSDIISRAIMNCGARSGEVEIASAIIQYVDEQLAGNEPLICPMVATKKLLEID